MAGKKKVKKAVKVAKSDTPAVVSPLGDMERWFNEFGRQAPLHLGVAVEDDGGDGPF